MVWYPKWPWLFNAIALINQESLRYLINHCSNNLQENCIMIIVANPKADRKAKKKIANSTWCKQKILKWFELIYTFEMIYEPKEVASRWPYKQMKNGITPLLPARPQRLSLTNSSVPMMWGNFGRWVASGPCLKKQFKSASNVKDHNSYKHNRKERLLTLHTKKKCSLCGCCKLRLYAGTSSPTQLPLPLPTRCAHPLMMIWFYG